MNILITGSAGFIGSRLVDELGENHKIKRLINGTSYYCSGDEVSCDLTDITHVERLLQENFRIDVIIHTASVLASQKNCEQFSLLSKNIKMYENLLLIISKFTPSKIINISSVAVYPNQDGVFSEASEIRPSYNADGLYGLSKFVGENVLDFFNKKSNTNIVHLRVSQVYGEGMREDRVMKIMQKELESENKITLFGGGKRKSDFIDIDILVSKIIFFIFKYHNSGVFNVGGKSLSYKSIAINIIKNHGDENSRIDMVNAGVSSEFLINSDKLKNEECRYEL